MARHKHAEIIHAWAEGAEIQRFDCGKWWDDPFPEWFADVEYRIKPRTVKREGWVNLYRAYGCELPSAATVHATEEAAKAFASIGLVATFKVEWSEEE